MGSPPTGRPSKRFIKSLDPEQCRGSHNSRIGAAGFFSAINVKENYPDADVTIFEKSKSLLSKVKVSAGGHCNLTNNSATIRELAAAYPRGQKYLKKAFQVFNNRDTLEWFESRAVPLVVQRDNCVFPESQNSQSIINCFLDESKKYGIKIEIGKGIKAAYKKAKEKKIITAVNQQYRWNPRIQAIREAIQKNKLGEIFLVNSIFKVCIL